MCLYAIIPFTVMSIGTFFIVYRVYYQQRRVFRSRRSNQNHSTNAVPNRAKSLFYLLFTLNILYFILVSPVVFVTTMLFRNPTEELAYPRLKSIIYLMQYANHSLNFIFYGETKIAFETTSSHCSSRHHFAPVPSNVVRMVRTIVSLSSSLLSTNDSKPFASVSLADRIDETNQKYQREEIRRWTERPSDAFRPATRVDVFSSTRLLRKDANDRSTLINLPVRATSRTGSDQQILTERKREIHQSITLLLEFLMKI